LPASRSGPGITTEPGTRSGVRCQPARIACGVHVFPARLRCVSCFSEGMERVELGRIGKVDAFTVVRVSPLSAA